MGTYVPYSTVSLNTGQTAAQEMVTERFDLVQAAASAFAETAELLQADLVTAIEGLEAPELEDPPVTIPAPTEITLATNVPVGVPDTPDAPRVTSISRPGITTISDPTYTAPDEPDIYAVDAPTENFPSQTPSPPNVNEIEYEPLSRPSAPAEIALNSIAIPDAIDPDYPDEPPISDLLFPSSPGTSTISFGGIAPNSSDITVPGVFSYDMSAFSNSAVWEAMVERLENDLVEGATGLDADIEAAIYQRHKDRQRVENDRLYQDTENMYGASGFNLPTGAMVARLSEINAEIARKEDGASLDITISQADLAQKNSQFSIEKAIQVGELLRNFYTQSEDLSFKIALETQNNAISIYNAQVAFFNMKLDEYKTEAAVYASRLQGELAIVEAYKVEVSAVGIKADIQKTQVETYAQRLEAINIQAQIYATQLEGVKVELGLENLKVESYNALVKVYGEQINAEKVNVEAYKTMIEAENLKIAHYSAEVDAYSAWVAAEVSRLQSLLDVERLQVEGSKLDVSLYESNIQAAIADIQAQAQIAQSQSEVSRTESANYAALVGAESDIFRSESANYVAKAQVEGQNYQNQTTQFTAEVNAKQDYNRTLLAEMSANVQYAASLVDAYMKKMDVIARSYVAVKELQTKGTEGAMNVSAQLAASAMTAVNASVGFSFDGSARTSASHTETMSLGEDHNFTEA